MTDWPSLARAILNYDKPGPEGDAARARVEASIASIFESEPPPKEETWLVKDDGHSDYNSVHTWRHIASVEKKARVSADEKISQIRMYLADHADDTLEEGERAIFTDITTILDGE